MFNLLSSRRRKYRLPIEFTFSSPLLNLNIWILISVLLSYISPTFLDNKEARDCNNIKSSSHRKYIFIIAHEVLKKGLLHIKELNKLLKDPFHCLKEGKELPCLKRGNCLNYVMWLIPPTTKQTPCLMWNPVCLQRIKICVPHAGMYFHIKYCISNVYVHI